MLPRWFAFAVLVWLALGRISLCQPQARPDPLDPTYEHDRWDTQPKNEVRFFRAYTTSFDGADDDNGDEENDIWAVPEWVAYEMRAGIDRGEFEPRPRPWHTDLELFNSEIAPRDQSYLNSGFSRGHMCMRQHARRLGRNADWNSHSMLNACPQHQDFNGGHWLSLEKLCSIWADGFERIWIICGPIMSPDGERTPQDWVERPNELELALPVQFFKIVVKESSNPNRPDILAFIYDHDPGLNDSSLHVDHTPFLHSVREVERRTGLIFFAALPSEDQDAIEETAATELWDVIEEGLRPRGMRPSDRRFAGRTYFEIWDAMSRLYDAETAREREIDAERKLIPGRPPTIVRLYYPVCRKTYSPPCWSPTMRCTPVTQRRCFIFNCRCLRCR